MIVDISEMKEYLRVDGEDEDDTIISLINSAESYLKNAGCALTDAEGTPLKLAQLAIKQLVVHWYENREPVGKSDRLTFSLDNIITQLQYCYGDDAE